MAKDSEMIGRQFGRLSVVSRVGSIKGKTNSRKLWDCVCTCGNHKIVNTRDLTNGHTQSCGCLADESRRKPKIDIAVRDEYNHLRAIWKNMKNRCYKPKNPEYNRYGGRGIKMCNEWLNSSKAFIEWGLKNGYSIGLSVDRIDNNGNYEPSNCQFLTRSENVLKEKKKITIGGVTLRYTELSNIVGCAGSYFNNKILRFGFNRAYIKVFRKLMYNIA
jgi:hypothetical protein